MNQILLEKKTENVSKMTTFWDTEPCCLAEINDRPDDEASKHLWNVNKRLLTYKAQQPRRRKIWGSHDGEYEDGLHGAAIQKMDIFISSQPL